MQAIAIVKIPETTRPTSRSIDLPAACKFENGIFVGNWRDGLDDDDDENDVDDDDWPAAAAADVRADTMCSIMIEW